MMHMVYVQIMYYHGRIELLTENLRLAIRDVSKGWPVIVVDDFDRENEGDIVVAAEMATKENLAFTARYARGIMCISATGPTMDRLNLPPMWADAEDPLETPFTVSCDAKYGTSTGVSVSDRLKTLAVFINEDSSPDDLIRPGHMFPLRAKDGLLKERQGHTEASVTLMKLAGMKPVAMISEIMNDDGSMAKLLDLEEFASEHHLRIVSIKEIKEAAGL